MSHPSQKKEPGLECHCTDSISDEPVLMPPSSCNAFCDDKERVCGKKKTITYFTNAQLGCVRMTPVSSEDLRPTLFLNGTYSMSRDMTKKECIEASSNWKYTALVAGAWCYMANVLNGVLDVLDYDSCRLP